ncbi:hypothetical protein OHB41_35980 [Streptomyces sp. NBC_01571]|uniref:hypothetical protein n=1 Tax=Streptomyces sp. NBC_01571 TaxID=2975883 RepID=UPI002256B62B|nr:hypothetical protein [Streptomyces sp. NBC_01571]MCX4578497.1 hypothetical protein [Streptomyces sp. NBC_01571]
MLLASFSGPGESYYHGDPTTLKVGDAEVMARKIRDLIDRDMYLLGSPVSFHKWCGHAVAAENVK